MLILSLDLGSELATEAFKALIDFTGAPFFQYRERFGAKKQDNQKKIGVHLLSVCSSQPWDLLMLDNWPALVELKKMIKDGSSGTSQFITLPCESYRTKTHLVHYGRLNMESTMDPRHGHLSSSSPFTVWTFSDPRDLRVNPFEYRFCRYKEKIKRTWTRSKDNQKRIKRESWVLGCARRRDPRKLAWWKNKTVNSLILL